MQVSVENVGALSRRMQVEIPETRVEGEVQGRLQSMARSVRLPGFRPGKVPFKVVAKRFGPQVRDEVVGELVRSSFHDAIVQEKLRPAGTPTIDPLNAEAGQGVSYTAVFDVFPDLDAPKVEGLVIRRPIATVEDSDVDKMIDTLRRQRRTWNPVERAATDGDRVTIDFEGFVDGERLDRTSGEGMQVEIGSGRLLDGFEEGLKGLSAGEETSLDLAFPADYHAKELAGKPVTFKVKVVKVEEGVLPEIDDEFVASFGVSEGGIDAFLAEVRRNMARELEDAVRARTKERVMNALLESNPVDVPESLVRDEARSLVQQRKQEFAQQGLDPATLELREEMFEDEARRRVSLGLLLAELVKRHELKADPATVRARVERIASTYEQPQEVISWYYGDRNRLGEIESSVLEEVIVEWILANAAVEDEASSFDAMMNPEQTATA